MKKQNKRPEEAIAVLMKKYRLTLAVAESCTGGLVSNKITDVPGSSEYFRGGIIAYSNDLKEQMLDVPQKILKKFGAVSKETAAAMARGARKNANADIGIAITGIAGPTGGSRLKPVGTVFIAVSDKKNEECRKFLFKGKRQAIKLSASNTALLLLKKFLERAGRVGV